MKIILTLIALSSHYVLYSIGFRRGVIREQQARLRRLNTLRKLVNTRE
jgi:hypothetical protein